jgi:hypothetical protein
MKLTDVIGLKGNLGSISHKLRKFEKNSTIKEVLIKDFQEVDQKIILIKGKEKLFGQQLEAKSQMEKEVKDICKILPRIIKDMSSSIIKGILDRIRRYVPKAYFKIIKARIG